MNRPSIAALLVAVSLAMGSAESRAQEPDTSAAAIVARIRSGGWFEQSKWQRGDDGVLQMFSFFDKTGPEEGRYLPLTGDALERALIHSGLFGFLSLVCHGDGDLLGMTDAAFHFGALGIEGTDAGLRQFLAVPMPSFDGLRGRADLLDRLLAIDVLSRRRVLAAVVELDALSKRDGAPPELRERAEMAVAMLQRRQATPRSRLQADTLRLPAAFDACILIDHARLPDLSWLTSLGRRLGALVTAQALGENTGDFGPIACNGVQSACDLCSELPFAAAHLYGNARVDHSCVVVSAKADARMPVAITWQAAGVFEHERWAGAAMPAGAAANNPLLAGSMVIEANELFASTDKSKGKPRPTMVEKFGLLRDDGSAMRAIVPSNSKLWPMLAGVQMPAASGAELRVVLGDPGVLTLVVETRDEEGAQAWLAKGRELLAEGKALVQTHPPVPRDKAKDLYDLIDAVLAAELEVKGNSAVATITVKGVTPAKIRAIAESMFVWPD